MGGIIHLEVEAVTCTQAWLRVQSPIPGPSGSFRLLRNGIKVRDFVIRGTDTVIVDEGLRPLTHYDYQIEGKLVQGANDLIANVSGTTLDTTSHSFVWEMVELGGDLGAGSSYLGDISILDGSTAYAAGAVYLLDSAGKGDTDAYNLLKWDGSTWTPMRVWFFTICGQTQISSYPSSSLYLSNNGGGWLSSGNQALRWSQTTGSNPVCLPSSVWKLWGSGPSSIYGVGYAGGMVHYDGLTWQSVSSPTTLYLNDVSGTIDDQHIWVCGWADNYGSSILTVLEGSKWRTIWDWSGTPRAPFGSLVSSVSVSGNLLFVASTGGVYQMSATGRTDARYLLGGFTDFIYRIRAAAPNDIIIAGDRASIWHFNGLTWKQMNSGSPDFPLYSADIKGNVAIAVGADHRSIIARALIFVGKR
jgi:hypothetical protein